MSFVFCICKEPPKKVNVCSIKNSSTVTEGPIWGTEREQRISFVRTRIIHFMYDTLFPCVECKF